MKPLLFMQCIHKCSGQLVSLQELKSQGCGFESSQANHWFYYDLTTNTEAVVFKSIHLKLWVIPGTLSFRKLVLRTHALLFERTSNCSRCSPNTLLNPATKRSSWKLNFFAKIYTVRIFTTNDAFLVSRFVHACTIVHSTNGYFLLL